MDYHIFPFYFGRCRSMLVATAIGLMEMVFFRGRVAARLVAYRNGHYEMGGILQRDDRFVFFRYSGSVHERSVPSLTDGAIHIRRADSATDYTGHGKWFTSLENFQRMSRTMKATMTPFSSFLSCRIESGNGSGSGFLPFPAVSQSEGSC